MVLSAFVTFEPYFQPWIGGGRHFAFFNQPLASKKLDSFCSALKFFCSLPRLIKQLDEIRDGFSSLMQKKLLDWVNKLGLDTLDAPLFNSLLTLMMKTHVDYTMFFRELCNIPEDVSGIAKSFYAEPDESLANEWHQWLTSWRESLNIAKVSRLFVVR